MLRFLFFLLASTHSVAQLSGIYTIGGTNPDYATIQSAINSAVLNGVNGPVDFHIRNGNYTELLQLDSFPGASAANTIVFRSESGDSSLVEIISNTTAAQNNSVRMDYCNYVSFHQLTFRQNSNINNNAVFFMNRGRNISITNCVISGSVAGVQATTWLIQSAMDTAFTLTNCELFSASDGVYCGNPFGIGYASQIENNVLHGIGGSTVFIDGDYFARIINNRIVTGGIRGILMQQASRYEISGNRITTINGSLNSCGIQLIASSGWPQDKAKVFNNSIYFQGTSSFVCYGVRSNSCSNLEFCHNTIYMKGGNGSYACYFEGAWSSGNEMLVASNNIAVMDTSSQNYLIYIPNAASYYPYLNSDYNNLYTAGPHLTPQYSSLAQYSAATGVEQHSISVDPLFTDTINLTPLEPSLYNTALPFSYITHDINGVARHPLYPDPGAYEVLNPPYLDLGSDTTVCDSLVLYAGNPGSTYLWSTSDTTASLTVLSSGTFYVEATNNAGSDTDTITVNLLASTPVSVMATDDSICPGSSIDLMVNGALSGIFNWSDTLSTDTLRSISPAVPAWYGGFYSNASGCLSYDSVYITVFSVQPAVFHLADTVWCEDFGFLALSGGIPAGGNYTGTGISNNIFDPNGLLHQTITITYTVTDSNACTSSASDQLFVDDCTGMEEWVLHDYLEVTPHALIWKGPEMQWQLFDTTGRLLAEGNQRTVDLGRLAGIYFVTFHWDGNSMSRKGGILSE